MVEPASYFSSYVSVPELPHVFQCPVFTPLDYTVFLGQTLNLLSFLIRYKINNLTQFCLSLHFLWILYFALRLLQYGDIKLNPGPKCFSVCHWNLNCLTAHNYLKVSQL